MTPSLCQLHMLDKTDAGELLSLLPSLHFLFIKPSHRLIFLSPFFFLDLP